jgi:hypothetical protein
MAYMFVDQKDVEGDIEWGSGKGGEHFDGVADKVVEGEGDGSGFVVGEGGFVEEEAFEVAELGEAAAVGVGDAHQRSFNDKIYRNYNYFK